MGHQEIMGTLPKKPAVHPFQEKVDAVADHLKQAGHKVEIIECEGLRYVLCDDYVTVADNLEADLGMCYNVTAPLDFISFEKEVEIARLVREVVTVGRVIVFGGTGDTMDDLWNAQEVKNGRFIGIASAKSKSYEQGYQCLHLGYGVDKNVQAPTILTAAGIPVTLIGKVADIVANDQGTSISCVPTKDCLDHTIEEFQKMEKGFICKMCIRDRVIGFGIPTSIAASIILIHCLLLTTDIIGSFCPDTKVGMIISAAVGAVYGLALLAGLEFIVNLFGMMPYNFTSDLGGVSNYVTVAFAVFPAVGVAYQHGFKKGTITAGVTVLVYYLIKKFGVFSIAGNTVSLNAEGMAMLAGMVMMIVFAAQIKGESNSNEALTQGFSGNVSRIRKNWFLLAIMGGLRCV